MVKKLKLGFLCLIGNSLPNCRGLGWYSPSMPNISLTKPQTNLIEQLKPPIKVIKHE